MTDRFPRHRFAGSTLVLWMGLCGLVAWSALGVPPAAAQEPSGSEGTEAPAPESEPVEWPGAHEVIPRSLDLRRETDALQETLDELSVAAEMEADLETARERQDDLAARSAALAGETYPQRHRVVQLQDLALLQRQDLASMSDRVSDRLERLEDLQSRWRERLEFWQGWREHLQARGGLGDLEGELDRAEDRIVRVTDRISETFRAVVDLQRRLEVLERDNGEILAGTESILDLRRQRRFERDAPPLLSAGYAASLREPWTEPAANLETLSRFGREWLDRFGWVLLVQILVAVAIALLVRRLRHRDWVGRRWYGILRHPWAVGVFVATATLSSLYVPIPSWWELVLVSVVAVSGALLASGLFAQAAKRRVVYALAAFYPLFLAAEVFGLPTPWIRLILAVSAAVGAVLGWFLSRRLAELSESSWGGGFLWALRLGTGALAVAVALELVGYHRLAGWLVESSIATAFVIFVTTFLVRLGRGGIQALVHRSASDRLRFLRRMGHYLALRLTWLLQVVLVTGAALYVLELWQLAPSPGESLARVLRAGFPVDEPILTVGQVLLAALVVYLSFVLSRVLRALLAIEVFEGRDDFDPGLGDSIQTLLHYTVATVGFLVGLSLLGVSLQNFAIVAGALGVGIGFGLQNIVQNFVSGLILLFERPVRAGDTIVIGGEWATVKKIGMRSTVVVTFDRSEIIVPNSDLVSEKVVNWTLSDKVARIVLPVGVAYGSDLETVFRLLGEAVAAEEKVLADPAPVIHFTAFGDSALQFEIRVWVEEIQDRLDVRSRLLSDIDRRFRDAGIQIPFPQRDLHVRTLPPGTR